MNEQGFYKSTGVEILYAPNYIQSPNYYITVNDKDSQSFPIDGWYYFDTKQEAESFFQLLPPVPSEIPLWAFRIVLRKMGMWTLIEQAIAQATPEEALIVQEYLDYGNFIERNSPMLEKFAHGLGLGDDVIDGIFREAGALKL